MRQKGLRRHLEECHTFNKDNNSHWCDRYGDDEGLKMLKLHISYHCSLAWEKKYSCDLVIHDHGQDRWKINS